jgi:hypothetical protein
MRYLLPLLFVALIAHAEDAPKPKYGPAGKPRAAPLAQDSVYLRTAAAPDYWSLAGFYVPQISGSACGVASVAMIVNGSRATLAREGKLALTADDKVVRQMDLLDKVPTFGWKDRSTGSTPGAPRGVDLDQLAQLTQESFHALGMTGAKARAVHVDPRAPGAKAQLRKDLAANEKSSHTWIIANFPQVAFTDDAPDGHIAPIAAYDAKRGRVLLLDPDRDYYEPYWVSVDTLFASFATADGKGEYALDLPDQQAIAAKAEKFRGYVFVEY